MTKAQRITEIKQEIEWYDPRKSIANAMLKLGEAGFTFSGHGCGFGGEDFRLMHKNIYVNFCDTGRKIIASVDKLTQRDIKNLFEGTVPQTLSFMKNKKLIKTP